jgi:hypothetical protein
MEAALRSYLLASSGLSALIGDRMTWGFTSQGGPLPRVTLQRISGGPEYADEGEVNLSETRVQIDCYAATSEAVRAVYAAIRARISGAQFTQSGVTCNGVYIDSVRDESDAYEGGRQEHRVSLDIMVWHTG